MLRTQLKKIKPLIEWYRKFRGLENGGDHWCRIVMDQETKKLINNLPISTLDVMEFSGNKWENTGFKSFSSFNYPDYDICRDVFENQFDLVIAEQVF